MCGITGYTGKKHAQPILLEALKRLEYRGYDSAGICVFDQKSGKLSCIKDKGTISHLESVLTTKIPGSTGIAHTRWATCGAPLKNNAHPFMDCKRKIGLVHNGIIENHKELRTALQRSGHIFTSETDTETVVHLVEKHYRGNLEDAVRKAISEIKGSYALAVVCSEEPGKIVGVRRESPLIVGLGKGENFIASDVPAVLAHTKSVIYLKDGEMAIVTESEVKVEDAITGKRIRPQIDTIKWSLEDAEKGGYDHFMLKEIFEQPSAIHNSLLGRVQDLAVDGAMPTRFESVTLIGCGTSYHASLVGKYILESLVKKPSAVELASEYRYSFPPQGMHHPLFIALTQSGETADTLAAVREARQRGCRTIGITNVVGSTITREADEIVFTQAGPEIGVAATKTFTTQLVALYLLGMKFAQDEHTLGYDEINVLQGNLRSLPRAVQNVLDQAERVNEVAKRLAKARDAFFIARSLNYPVALEGALKLKEISYIHAEGYPAGELKHGPLALLTKDTPLIAIAVPDHTYDKVLSNIAEVSARGAPVIAIGYEGDKELEQYADEFIGIPEVPTLFSPIPVTVVLQLLAYYTANRLGCEIDKPRNLAKSVTVE